jgi:hypothetical protein
MARRYSRDNRGRFAPSGSSAGGGGKVGATARGGRLRTAAGNKRATQTTKAAAAKPSGTVAGKPKRKPAAAGKIKQTKPQAQVSNARQAATDRLKVKTATRRKLSANRESVIPSTPKGPKTMRTQRVSNTVPKSIARTKGNEKAKVTKRVNSKVYTTDKQLASNLQLRSKGLLVNGKNDVKLLKRSITLKKAQNYLATGKVVRDNSMAAQRSLRQAKDRLAAKNTTRAAARPVTAKPTTQKQRWASRSAMLNNAAAKNEVKAKSMFDAANTAGNTAFNTQPGRLAGRARMNAQTERSFKLQEKAAQQRSRAANLERMANTNKGDAAKRRSTRADVVKNSYKGLKKGDTVEGILYGKREVVKVNAKSVTVKGAIKNFTIPWESIKPKQ